MNHDEYQFEEWASDPQNRWQIPIERGEPMEELVSYIFESHAKHVEYSDICDEVEKDYEFHEDDSLLAVDYVLRGMFAAITGNPRNRPDPKYEPLALLAFETIWKELPRKHFLSGKRVVSDKWLEWHQKYLESRAKNYDQ